MKWIGRAALAVLGLVVVLAVIVAVRTATYKPPAAADLAAVKLAAPITIDNARAAQRLGEAVRILTISHQDPAENQPAEWEKLHAWLEATYPAAHRAMRRDIVANRTLVYTWPGSDPSLPPIILMAHQDVVPVTEGTEKDWKHPPFSGEIADGAVWGRGSVDDKGSLVALFEAVEALSSQGFAPRRTVILVSGEDEEVRGVGARAAAAFLQARGVKAEFVLDEGSLVVADNPVTGGPAALIGVAEKGYGTLVVTAKAPGGHSSVPPKTTGVVTLARAVVAISERSAPMAFEGPGAEMLRTLAPTASPTVKMAVANEWLFKPLLIGQIGATPAGAAMLHTTIAPTMLKGSPKENVLPQDATAWINYRIAPGDSAAAVMARARAAVGALPVSLAWTRTPDEASAVSSTRSDGWKILAALASEGGRLPVAPSLVVAGTDSRYLQPVAQDVYRFQPMVVPMHSVGMIHGTNEHMTLDNLARMTGFYARLIATAASR
ncbi:MAG TPA: M20 family peptidase [Caulobacteraceae bacterium]|nr:M20 family peptidase [Caulobacteraceae bacterium]